MIITYSILANPDSENPNEQAIGNFIQDDRIYGISKDQIVVVTQTQSYNKEQINKAEMSNKLSIPIDGFSFGVGTNVTIITG